MCIRYNGNPAIVLEVQHPVLDRRKISGRGRACSSFDRLMSEIARHDRAEATVRDKSPLEPSRSAAEHEGAFGGGRQVPPLHVGGPVVFGFARDKEMEVAPHDRRGRPHGAPAVHLDVVPTGLHGTVNYP